jgi:hypothetical protein
MNHKFNVGETVKLVSIKSRDVYIKVIEKIEGKPHYKLDWGSCGFNSILNTVSIAESAMKKAT